MASQASLLNPVTKNYPMLGVLMNVQSISVMLTARAGAGESLIEITATVPDAQMAMGLSKLVSMTWNQRRRIAERLPVAPNANETDLELTAIVKKIISSARITTEEEKIRFQVPVPDNFDRVPELLRPTLKLLSVTSASST